MKENSIGKIFTKKKKWIMILTPILSLLLAGAVVTTAILLRKTDGKITIDKGNTDVVEKTDGNKTDDSQPTANPTEKDPSENKTEDKKEEDKKEEQTPPVSGNLTVFADPVKEMNLIHTFGFYYNPTLNSYYEHRGLDVSAQVGDEVYSALDGTVSAIYLNDVLLGNSVSIENGSGVSTVYHFIDPIEGLTVGERVYKGEIIGSVSSPTGSEYKDGAHVHLEVYVNGQATDPENYLVATEK